MLTEEELRRLLSEGESDRVEFTESEKKTDKFAEAICAFANDLPDHRLPGYLLVGVKDDRSLAGPQVTEPLLQTLAAIRSDGNVLPPPSIQIEKFSLEGGEIAVVEVKPSDQTPVRYKGRIWVRIGARRAIATEADERILIERRVARARSFDASPCGEASVHELALGLFDAYRREAVDEEILHANHRPLEQQLASLRLFDPARACPTHAGILLLGKNPRYFLPGAYVQYLRLPGTHLTDPPEDQAEISGDLLTVLRELEGRLRLLIHTRLERVSPLQERLLPDYPEWAMRELLMNAILHRNYDSNAPIRWYAFADRMEIQSPGGLYGEATRENFPTRNSYRNPVIAEALKVLGFVNRFGAGVARAQRLLEENGNPPAEFDFDNHSFLVVIRGRST